MNRLLYIYIFIYIYVCVCVCMHVRAFCIAVFIRAFQTQRGYPLPKYHEQWLRYSLADRRSESHMARYKFSFPCPNLNLFCDYTEGSSVSCLQDTADMLSISSRLQLNFSMRDIHPNAPTTPPRRDDKAWK